MLGHYLRNTASLMLAITGLLVFSVFHQKFLKKAVFTQVDSYLRENNILYDYQSGFGNSFSTDTCLIHLTDYIQNQVYKANYTGLILLDLQKAFDTFDHDILCRKLGAMGIDSVEWFRSYLSGRKQIVHVKKVDFDPLQISCGVPQDSILGPLLFLCYVNDMVASVDCKLLLYADDSALLVSDKNPKCVADKLSKELESCRQWLVDNKLSLHLVRLNVFCLTQKTNLRKSTFFSDM